MHKILFICLGNICRSPMAEAVMRDLVVKKGIAHKFDIDSCGTGNYHVGERPHRGTQSILNQHHISYEGIIARQLCSTDIISYDWMIAMDDSNVKTIKRRYPNALVYKITDFIENTRYSHVPDPYYEGNFDLTYAIISEGCIGLLNKII